MPRHALGASIAVLSSGYHDALTVVPFSVPITSVVMVTGGGAALQTAVTAAAPGTQLLIQDSLAYSPLLITGKTNLTISADSMMTPSITAAAGGGNAAIKFGAGNSGVKVNKLLLNGNGNGNSGNLLNEGIIGGTASVLMATIDRVIIEDCTFGELVPASGAPAIQFNGTDGSVHQNIWIHRCKAIDCGSNPSTTADGYGTMEVSGFTNVYMQSSIITRTAALARAASNMRGFTWKSINVIVEDCMTDDIGTAGSNENFKHHEELIFGTAVGNSSLRNCVAYNCKRGYRITLGGAIMTVNESVANNATVGIAAAQVFVRQTAGTMIFTNSVIQGAGDGTAFEATVTENHNDVFNVAAPGKVLDATDQTIDALFKDVPNRVFLATAVPLQTGASDAGLIGVRYGAGEKIPWVGTPLGT
jgi:hypothetical protein